MKEIIFLTMADSEPGFALTGVRQLALTADEAWETIQQVCTDPEIGVVATDSRLLEKVDPLRLRELTDRWPGVFVTLPAPADRRAGGREVEVTRENTPEGVRASGRARTTPPRKSLELLESSPQGVEWEFPSAAISFRPGRPRRDTTSSMFPN